MTIIIPYYYNNMVIINVCQKENTVPKKNSRPGIMSRTHTIIITITTVRMLPRYRGNLACACNHIYHGYYKRVGVGLLAVIFFEYPREHNNNKICRVFCAWSEYWYVVLGDFSSTHIVHPIFNFTWRINFRLFSRVQYNINTY